MAFFDDLFGGTQARAFDTSADVARGGFNRNVNTLGQSFADARGELGSGFDAAINTLSGAGNEFRRAGATARGDIDRGLADARGLFGQGREALGRAGDRFAGLEGISGSFSPARSTLIGALGLGGPEAAEAARGTFESSLQPTFEFDQGLEAINRARAARGAGTISGGNIDRDTQVFGQQLANSRTNQFLDRLFGLTDREIGTAGTAAAGRSMADTGIAGMFGQEAGAVSNAAANRANIAQATADRIADIARGTAGLQTGRGQSFADLALRRGQGIMNLQDQLDQNVINSILGGAGARNQGAANVFGLGTNLLGSIANAAGTAAGGYLGRPRTT